MIDKRTPPPLQLTPKQRALLLDRALDRVMDGFTRSVVAMQTFLREFYSLTAQERSECDRLIGVPTSDEDYDVPDEELAALEGRRSRFSGEGSPWRKYKRPPTTTPSADGVPDDVSANARIAYLQGLEAKAKGLGMDQNPYHAARGIAGSRRIAWERARTS